MIGCDDVDGDGDGGVADVQKRHSRYVGLRSVIIRHMQRSALHCDECH